MKGQMIKQAICLISTFIFSVSALIIQARPTDGDKDVPVLSLLPEMKSWDLLEAPQKYLPANLYEYIDGAAEIYLSYDFQELVVAQYREKGSRVALTVEIYDMGNEKNSFGIYSVERFKESTFLAIGNQGYVEEGALNFVSGNYYLKLLCFDSGQKSEDFLKLFAQEIEKRVKIKGSFPRLLQFFPQEGLIPNSEKFILRNFLGFRFLNNGYVANYKQDGFEFDCFFVEAATGEEAEDMLKKCLKQFAEKGLLIQNISTGFHVQDPYLQHVFLARAGNILAGVTRIADGSEGVGQKYLRAIVQSLKEN